MSWQTKSVMEQKILFIKMWQSGNYTMTSLCDRFNISRTTGHKLVKRFFDNLKNKENNSLDCTLTRFWFNGVMQSTKRL